MTLNEPQVFIKFGHGDGHNAPGLKTPPLRSTPRRPPRHDGSPRPLRPGLSARPRQKETLHRLGPRLRRQAPKDDLSVPDVTVSQSPHPADIEAARQATCGITLPDLWNNAWFNDPVLKGEYPADGLALYGASVPKFDPADLKIIHQPPRLPRPQHLRGPARPSADGNGRRRPVRAAPSATP